MNKVGIIGAGKVGTSIGKYLFSNTNKATLCGYYSKSMSSSDFASNFTRSAQFENLEELVKKCDILIITTPDDIIYEVWEEISKYNIQNKIVCHCSGSLSSEIFFNASEKAVKSCSMHPLMAVSDIKTSYVKMKDSYFTLEGDEDALKVMTELIREKGNKYKIINSQNKVKYHVASVFMSNLVIGIASMAFDLMDQCGFSEKESVEAMKFLALENMEKLFESDLESSLTGPIERNDCKIVSKHLKLLEELWDNQKLNTLNNAYRILSLCITEIAEKKHPDRDYSSIKSILKNRK